MTVLYLVNANKLTAVEVNRETKPQRTFFTLVFSLAPGNSFVAPKSNVEDGTPLPGLKAQTVYDTIIGPQNSRCWKPLHPPTTLASSRYR